MNKKYDVANRLNGSAGGGITPSQQPPTGEASASPWADEPSAGFKKAPPPPVPTARKPGPPPVPLGSKPKG